MIINLRLYAFIFSNLMVKFLSLLILYAPAFVEEAYQILGLH